MYKYMYSCNKYLYKTLVVFFEQIFRGGIARTNNETIIVFLINFTSSFPKNTVYSLTKVEV